MSEQTPSTDTLTVVLVHGAFADGSSWNGVIERLQAAGIQVTAPANPLRGVASDSAYMASVFEQIPGPVLAVGHSYGGAVISNAATVAENVVGLVFVSAFATDEGEVLPQEQAALMAATQRPVSEVGFSDRSDPPAWKNLPSWAVVATADKAAGADLVRSMAERAGATITELDGSHVIMVSQPEAVADVIMTAAAAVDRPTVAAGGGGK
jgi:pimeloyl-ACP methyl ester carboxylesterase